MIIKVILIAVIRAAVVVTVEVIIAVVTTFARHEGADE